MRTIFRQLKREPFVVCYAVGFVSVCAGHGFSLPLWSLPLTIASYAAVWFADELWQAHLDRNPLESKS